ncbi:hypothetical protein K402DRAFT_348625 [Aulographum hederae CBS 113979]|uniref:Restriction of telomere capping protein 5 n=1 Tax=Aulographum hederae CBS 113979 TaxID=1176131 RepID=A0A6G1HBQ1_9PEZI|nr:hypothetical protein K402DRAFT_348625 [Aulographum hederae CBS 113979]
MGQGHSEPESVSIEQLSQRLTNTFATKCYTPLELYSFKSTFRSLADSESSLKYWSEATLCRFLELPDALAVGPVVFQMASYLGAFPFPSQAPAILTAEALLRVVTLLTERHRRVVKRGRREWRREVYRSLAVYDRAAVKGGKSGVGEEEGKGGEGAAGFAVDQAKGDEDEEEEEDDELLLAAFESMDATEAFKHGEKSNVYHSIIPSDNFLKLLELLLVIAPLEPQDNISTFCADLSDERIEALRKTAGSVLASFSVEKHPGIPYRTFDTVISSSLPHLFDSLNPLFSHFLFAKDLDLSKRKGSQPNNLPALPPTPSKPPPAPSPILAKEGEILTLPLLSQISFFIPPNSIFRRLQPLYSGGTQGFSMGQFEKSVLKWRAPSILLVKGSLLPSNPTDPRGRTFTDSLPPKRLPNSCKAVEGQTVTCGAYIPLPWKTTPRECFGNTETLLFQLAPQHAIFKASSLVSDYVYLNKSPNAFPGVGFGSPCPQAKGAANSHMSSRLGLTHHIPLGPISLHLDDALEFGVFTHIGSSGGSFLTPPHLVSSKTIGGSSVGVNDWQDRFEIDALEVWGCGGDEEAEEQRKAWAWEEREAEARRRVNLGTGDVEMDRELLRMAGVIGGERSGGSMG